MKCVEITMMDDGTCRVAECAPKQEMAGAGMMEGDEQPSQSYPTVDEALSAAGQMLGQQAQPTQPAGEQALMSAQKGYMSRGGAR